MQFLANACMSLTSIGEPVTFWIDSLCVPENPPLRKLAIQQMASVYRSAGKVIVLDHTLQKQTIQAKPEVLMMRIYTSPWMDRVWTFQEGVLARQLYFKLEDAYCPFHFSLRDTELVAPLQISILNNSTHDVYLHLRREVSNVYSQYRPPEISHVIKELKWRQTSKHSDELLAVSVLLDLDVNEILKQNDEEGRMVAFLTMVDKLPRNIIFAEAHRRVMREGFRWAPTTFLTNDPRRLDMEKSVKCSELGLFGEYMVFSPAKPHTIKYDSKTRFTIVNDQPLSWYQRFVQWTRPIPDHWFDLMYNRPQESFSFSHIILYSLGLPESEYGKIIVAVAVLQEDLSDEVLEKVRARYGRVDLICALQAHVVLFILRHFLTPPPKSKNGGYIIAGKFEKLNVLFR
jgi:hypothetical protein